MTNSKCPVCQKPTVSDFTPFCSAHCKNVDLLKWLNEDYKVPTQIVEEEEISLPLSNPEDEED